MHTLRSNALSVALLHNPSLYCSMGKKGSKPGFRTLADIPSVNTYTY